jgi:hypothetical protein
MSPGSRSSSVARPSPSSASTPLLRFSAPRVACGPTAPSSGSPIASRHLTATAPGGRCRPYVGVHRPRPLRSSPSRKRESCQRRARQVGGDKLVLSATRVESRYRRRRRRATR